MAVTKPVISQDLADPASKGDTQTAVNTICDYIDEDRVNLATLLALLQDIRRRLRAAGIN